MPRPRSQSCHDLFGVKMRVDMTLFQNSTPMTPAYDIIVVGLGASGTAAATTLARAGKRVLALEAQDRVGGRIHTVPFGDSLIELGAEWIHGTKKSSIYDAAVKNNVTMLPQDMSFNVYFSDGTSEHKEIINDLIEFCLQIVEDPPQEPESLGQFVTRRVREYIISRHPTIADNEDFIQSFLDFMDLLVGNYESSNSWNDVSTDTSYEELVGHQYISWHSKGYKTLFEIMMNTYNGGPGLPSLSTRLNTAVTRVEWPRVTSETVRVTTAAGDTVTARAVIVTVSVGVLKERHATLFSPPLPAIKVKAIENLTIGVMDKVIMLFDEVFWPRDSSFYGFFWKESDKKKVNASDWWTTQLFGASYSMGNRNALTVWTSGEGGKLVETLPEDVVKRKMMEVIRKFMGADKTIPDPVAMIRSTWYSNPYIRGSYTYDNVKSPLYPTARADLAAPLTDSAGAPRVLFAGEATDNAHFSTVHGAVDSGRREAMRLLSVSSRI